MTAALLGAFLYLARKLGQRWADDAVAKLDEELRALLVPRLRRLFESPDAAGIDAPPAVEDKELVAYLEANPVSQVDLLRATLAVPMQERLPLLGTLLQRICAGVAELPTMPTGQEPAGVAALAGSLVGPDSLTVIDTRLVGGGPFSASSMLEEDAVSFGIPSRFALGLPRMWILHLSDGSGPQAKSRDLNELLLSKHGAPGIVELGDFLTASSGVSSVRQVSRVHADRVLIHYPDPELASRTKEWEQLPLVERSMAIFNAPSTAAQRLEAEEAPLFDIKNATGTATLWRSIEDLLRETRGRLDDESEGFGDLKDP